MDSKKFFKKLFIFFVVGLIGIIALVATLAGNKSKSEEAAQNNKIDIVAYDLAKDYTENEVKANKDYDDKLVSVKGTIGDIGGNELAALVTIAGYSSNYIQCEFRDKEQIKKVADLKKGKDIKVTGTVKGKYENIIILNNCEID